MLVACRLAGLSAVEGHYAGVERGRNSGRREPQRGPPGPCASRDPVERRSCDISSAVCSRGW